MHPLSARGAVCLVAAWLAVSPSQAQKDAECIVSEFAARAQEVNDACCAGAQPGQGHRRMQDDCTLPETCPSELCADVFSEFFEQCNPILVSTAGVPLSDYQQFNECCQGFMRRDCSSCVDPTCRAQSNGPAIHLPGPGDFRPTHQCGVGTQYVPADAPVDAKGGSRAEFEFFGHCQDHAGDGVCDDECSTRACGLDGGDCPRVFGCAPRCACCMCLVEGHSEVDCEKQGFDCHCMFGRDAYGPCPDHGDDTWALQLCGDQDNNDPRCFGARRAAMEAACCSNPGECVDGVPTSCNRQCAAVLLPYVEDCGFKLDPSTDPLFEAAIAACEAEEVAADVMFDGSQIITADQGDQINEWVYPGQRVTWEKCYSSFADELTPHAFHHACDGYGSTLTIVRTARGDIFGGFASRPFGVTECCIMPGNECFASEAITYCYDHAASRSFVFRLAEEPIRYSATEQDTHFLYNNYETWPAFGASQGSDLTIGSGGAPGFRGSCNHGTGTTAFATHDVCGGPGDWGQTDVEVWHVEDEYLADHYTSEDGGVAIEGTAGHIHHTAFPCLQGCCASSPCQNGGLCEESVAIDKTGDILREYECHCASGFDGSDCERAPSSLHTGGQGR